MSSNHLPTNSAQLIGLAQKMHHGIVKLRAVIPVTMVTAAQMQDDVDAFAKVGGDFNAARSAQAKASGEFQTEMGKVYETGCWR